MQSTPNKLNLSFARNAYNVFGSRNVAAVNEHQREQKTELLEGKYRGGELGHRRVSLSLLFLGHKIVTAVYIDVLE